MMKFYTFIFASVCASLIYACSVPAGIESGEVAVEKINAAPQSSVESKVNVEILGYLSGCWEYDHVDVNVDDVERIVTFRVYRKKERYVIIDKPCPGVVTLVPVSASFIPHNTGTYTLKGQQGNGTTTVEVLSAP